MKPDVKGKTGDLKRATVNFCLLKSLEIIDTKKLED